MPAYCTNCGSPVSGPFCGSCGQRVQASAAPPQPAYTPPPPPQPSYAPPPQQPLYAQAPAQPAASPAKSSGLGKVLLIAGAIIFFFLVAGTAASIYGVYWFKNKAMSKVSNYTGGIVGGPTEVRVAKGNACALLSRDELQQILGVNIEKTSEVMEGSEPGCAYYTDPAGFAQLRNLATEEARKQAEAAKDLPASKSDNPLSLLKNANQLEGVVKALALTEGGDKDGRAFAFTVNRNFGHGNWAPLHTTMSVVPGFEDVQGVGDRAMMGSFGHTLLVLKGDTEIALELTWVPDARTRGADIARKIASHL